MNKDELIVELSEISDEIELMELALEEPCHIVDIEEFEAKLQLLYNREQEIMELLDDTSWRIL